MAVRFSTENTRDNFYKFKVEDLIINPEFNGRTYDPDLKDLIASIKANGQLQPIGVRKNSSGEPEIIYGFSRSKAIAAINEERGPDGEEMLVKCVVHDCNEEEAFLLNVEENMRRNAVSPVDIAFNIRRLRDQFSKTDEDIAKIFNRSGAWVGQHVKILSLDAATRKAVHKGDIPAAVAFTLADIEPDKRGEILAEAKANNPKGKVTGANVLAAARKQEALPEGKTPSRKMSELKKFLIEEGEQLMASKAKELVKEFVKYVDGTLTDAQMHNRLLKYTDGESYGGQVVIAPGRKSATSEAA